MNFLEIDGCIGGGQILRSSLSLSAILGKPFKIINIRANRPNPGLKHQHLICVNAVKEICDAKVKGAELDSEELIFCPKTPISGKYIFDIQTAGAIGLVLQTLIPLSVYGEFKFIIKGGTHVPFATNLTYLEKVFLPVLKDIGIKTELKINKYGFYPKGGGEIEFFVSSFNTLKPINILNSFNEEPEAEILLCDLPDHIADREKKVLGDINTHIKKQKTLSPGNAIIIYKKYCGISKLGRIGVPAEKIAQQTLDEFNKYKGYSMDKYLGDQLLIYMALCDKKSEILVPEFTEHIKTNIICIETFIGKIFEVNGNKIIKKEI